MGREEDTSRPQKGVTRGVTLSRTVLGKRDTGLVRRAASMLGRHGDLADVDRLRTMALRKTLRTGGMREAAKIIRRLHDPD